MNLPATVTMTSNGSNGARIALSQTAGLQLHSLKDYQELASVLVASNFCTDVTETAQAVFKMLYGAELGLPPIASLNGIYIQESNKKIKEGNTERWVKVRKPCITAGMMGTLIKRSGKYNYRIVKHTNELSEIEVFEEGKSVGVFTFSKDDAKTAELLDGPNAGNYKKYPRNMLFSRNISNIAKQACADIFGGAPVYTPEELNMLVDGESGEPIETTATEVVEQVEQKKPVAPKPKAAPTATDLEKSTEAPAPSTAPIADPKPEPASGAESEPASDTKDNEPAGKAGVTALTELVKKYGADNATVKEFMKNEHGVTKENMGTKFTWGVLNAVESFLKAKSEEEAEKIPM